MTDKPLTSSDCTRYAAEALHAASDRAGDPSAETLIAIAEQWMNLARIAPMTVPQQYPYPPYPPAIPQQYLGYGYQPPQVPDFPPEDG